MYTPDNWIIIKIKDFYKVLCGTSGGYLEEDSWKMNSGISKIEEDDEAYYIHGFSGSVYKCRKGCEMLRYNCSHIYDILIEADTSIKRVNIVDIIDEVNNA